MTILDVRRSVPPRTELEPVRCSSVLNPVYAWLTPEASDHDLYQAVFGNNDEAAERVVAAAGGADEMIDRIHDATGVLLAPPPGVDPSWDRLMVTEDTVEAVYRRLAAVDPCDARRGTVLSLMRMSRSTFGIRPTLAGVARIQSSVLGAKTGCGLVSGTSRAVTVAVVLGLRGGPLAGITTTELAPAEIRERSRLALSSGPNAVEALHESWAGAELRAAMADRFQNRRNVGVAVHG